jgi:hypothetical protein
MVGHAVANTSATGELPAIFLVLRRKGRAGCSGTNIAVRQTDRGETTDVCRVGAGDASTLIATVSTDQAAP